MLDQAIGPNVIRSLKEDMSAFHERNAHRGWTRLEDFRGLMRNWIVPQSQIRRPEGRDYHGGHDNEGYAAQDAPATAKEGKR